MKHWYLDSGRFHWTLHVDTDGVDMSSREDGSPTFASSVSLRDFLDGEKQTDIRAYFGPAVLAEALAHAAELLRGTPPPDVLVPAIECSICTQIVTPIYARSSEGQSLPAAASKLELASGAKPTAFDKDHHKRCPQCWTYYSYTYSYEFLYPRSEEDEGLYRLEPHEVVATLADADRREYLAKFRAAIDVWAASERTAVREHAEKLRAAFDELTKSS